VLPQGLALDSTVCLALNIYTMLLDKASLLGLAGQYMLFFFSSFFLLDKKWETAATIFSRPPFLFECNDMPNRLKGWAKTSKSLVR
jgi:hypothetical protein